MPPLVLPTRIKTLVFILLYYFLSTYHHLPVSHLFVLVCLSASPIDKARAFIGFVLCCAFSTRAGTGMSDSWILEHTWFHSADICVFECPQWWTLFILAGAEKLRITSDHISLCKTCLCFNFSFLKNRSMHMAQILEMCIYFSAAAGFVRLVRKGLAVLVW